MLANGNPKLISTLVSDMTMVQKVVFDYLMDRYNIYITGSRKYNVNCSDSDFDFFINQKEIKSETRFKSELNGLCRTFKETMNSYSDEGFDNTGYFFSPCVYRTDIGIDIQIVYDDKIERKLMLDNTINQLCSVFDINKRERQLIMAKAVQSDAKNEKRVISEIVGDDEWGEYDTREDYYYVIR